jgi:hypothetical protein
MQVTVNGDISNELQGDIFKESRHKRFPFEEYFRGETHFGKIRSGRIESQADKGSILTDGTEGVALWTKTGRFIGFVEDRTPLRIQGCGTRVFRRVLIAGNNSIWLSRINPELFRIRKICRTSDLS